MKFSANISTLFANISSLIERFKLASIFKFEAIECQAPYNHSLDEWKNVFDECTKKNLNLPKWDLINSIPVFSTFNQIPPVHEFNEKILKKTIKYACFFKVKKVHLVLTDVKNDLELQSVLDLLKFSCEQLAKHNIICVIEPLSIRDSYYLTCYKQAKKILADLKQVNLKILLDSYHIQKLNGNLTTLVNEISKNVGHVQISQIPLRDNPMNKGELDFYYFLNLVASTGYDDYVGLEYNENHIDDTQFSWLEKFKNL